VFLLKLFRAPPPLGSNIFEIFSPVSLAFIIMGDGYWDNDSGTVLICTDNFTEEEVQILINLLKSKFGLIATKKRRIRSNGIVC